MMMIGVSFTVCVIKCTLALIFFKFSVNTDVLGQSLEDRVNEVLLYSALAR